MLDAFIIDQIEKKDEKEPKWEPVPLTIPLEIEQQEEVLRQKKPKPKITIQL